MAPGTPQIPVDLPPCDELVWPQIDARASSVDILKRFGASRLNVYTVRAEAEGIVMPLPFAR